MSSNHPLFISLPPEIRFPIYDLIFQTPSAGFHLLDVCHQTRNDVWPILLKTPRFFKSMEDFIDWASRTPTGLGQFIKEIHIECHANWWAKFMAAYKEIPHPMEYRIQHASTSVPTANTLAEWKQRYVDLAEGFETSLDDWMRNDEIEADGAWKSSRPLEATWQALCMFKNVQIASLVLNGGLEKAFTGRYNHHQLLMLEMAANAWPHLRELAFSSGVIPISFLRLFTQLRALRLPGPSITSPDKTLDILQNMKHLDTLALRRYARDDFRNVTGTFHFMRDLAFTPGVVGKMNPLRQVELLHEDEDCPPMLITGDMMLALHNHADTLESLAVRSNATVNSDVVSEISRLLPHLKKLRALELAFEIPAPFNEGDLDIPTTVEKCVVDIKQKWSTALVLVT
ncbi:hypothetical protein AWENTII_002985 [Aspergillus wentii]|nr:hypothetical protein MW887_007251 [Aspergillus wentii]